MNSNAVRRGHAMWLDKNRIAEVLKDNGMTHAELAKELGLQPWQVEQILNGITPANRRQAQSMLTLFGIWSICWAMKQNWKWMPYAIQAIVTH